MIDFALTNKGDLILEEQPVLPDFRLDFRIGKHPGMLMKFMCVPVQTRLPLGDFKMSFNTKAHVKEAKYRATLVDDIKEAAQQVIIRLRTEVTELPERQTVGSRLSTVKHNSINSVLNLSTIETMTAEAVKNIVPNVEVVAKAEEGMGSFYCQNVNVYIYSDGVLFHKFNI